MRRIPSLAALRTFEVAARLHSFTDAGRALNVSPSAVSHQVHALEEHFGCKLFERQRRRVELTPEGTALREQLSAAFDIIESACADLGQRVGARPFVVHSSPSFASNWLSPRLSDFLRNNPKAGLRILSSAEAVDLLHRHDLDAVISYGPVAPRPGLVVVSLGDEEILPLCSPALATSSTQTGGEIFTRLPLIESSMSPVRWAEWFALNDLPATAGRGGPSFDRGAMAVAAAAQGLGIALESRRFAEEGLARGDLVVLGEGHLRPARRRLHFLTYRESQKTSRLIEAFRDWLLGQASAPGGPPGAAP